MKRALLVGINEYDEAPQLSACVADATALAETLERHEDGAPNYTCRVLIDPPERVTRSVLRQALESLFDFEGDVLFYFSGHGTPTKLGGYLVTHDAAKADVGLPMDDLVRLANASRARQVLVILDCCFSGDAGNVIRGEHSFENQAQLREGVTIIAASGSTEVAMETGGHGLFTSLVLAALRGGAADVRGNVSAAAVYGYAEAVLGAWDQRPIYKSHARSLAPIRRCNPPVPDTLLRELPQLFPKSTDVFALDPSFEYTHASAKPENVEIFNKFKTLRNARLLTTVSDPDLYWAALHSTQAKLTPLGEYYWQLASQGRI